jgi:hypothetical protein
MPGAWYSGINAESVVRSTMGLDVIESSLSFSHTYPRPTGSATFLRDEGYDRSGCSEQTQGSGSSSRCLMMANFQQGVFEDKTRSGDPIDKDLAGEER